VALLFIPGSFGISNVDIDFGSTGRGLNMEYVISSDDPVDVYFLPLIECSNSRNPIGLPNPERTFLKKSGESFIHEGTYTFVEDLGRYDLESDVCTGSLSILEVVGEEEFDPFVTYFGVQDVAENQEIETFSKEYILEVLPRVDAQVLVCMGLECLNDENINRVDITDETHEFITIEVRTQPIGASSIGIIESPSGAEEEVVFPHVIPISALETGVYRINYKVMADGYRSIDNRIFSFSVVEGGANVLSKNEIQAYGSFEKYFSLKDKRNDNIPYGKRKRGSVFDIFQQITGNAVRLFDELF
tara:strand:+ start:2378 stop:3283 length:906 start_codon:yes stop_codon:yes gene_type:complete